jgi:hypothetical protein
LRTVTGDRARAPGLPPTGQTSSTPAGLYPASDWASCSARPALCYRALLALPRSFCTSCSPDCWLPSVPAFGYCRMPKVTSLDPRTPHQPVKLQKLSKNDYGFTPSKIWVNRKIEIACALLSIECSSFTGVCSAICADTHIKDRKPQCQSRFSRISRDF